MEEKKHLKNFKCQNPECRHEFVADEFEALECPVCHTEGIGPSRPPLTNYIRIAIILIGLVLSIYYLKECSNGDHKITFRYDTINCELTAYVDDLEDQKYYYVLGNNQVIQFKECTFKIKSIGNHTIHIFSEENFDPNSQKKPIASGTYNVPKLCEGNQDKISSGVAAVQTQLQFLRIKPGKVLVIVFTGGKGTAFEFSINGLKGPFQKVPDFPNAPCKEYKPGELVVKCISDGQIAHNPSPLRFDDCKQVASSNPPPPAGPNPSIKSLFDGLISGSSKIGDSYEINPGNMSDPIQIYHSSNSTPETIPFYDYMVRLTADNNIRINKVTSAFKWGPDSKGKQVPVPINIKVYEDN